MDIMYAYSIICVFTVSVCVLDDSLMSTVTSPPKNTLENRRSGPALKDSLTKTSWFLYVFINTLSFIDRKSVV